MKQWWRIIETSVCSAKAFGMSCISKTRVIDNVGLWNPLHGSTYISCLAYWRLCLTLGAASLPPVRSHYTPSNCCIELVSWFSAGLEQTTLHIPGSKRSLTGRQHRSSVVGIASQHTETSPNLKSSAQRLNIPNTSGILQSSGKHGHFVPSTSTQSTKVMSNTVHH
jgi:hypothetical protein